MLGSLVATVSLLSRVIESQGQDVEIVSIRDRVQSGTDSCHGRVSGINKICFLCSSYCRSQATAA